MTNSKTDVYDFIQALDIPDKFRGRIWRAMMHSRYTLEDLKRGLETGGIFFLRGVGLDTSDTACEAYQRYLARQPE